jgi:endogenous inhibitor of DNA gyrase (YacG/DUF329 family)
MRCPTCKRELDPANRAYAPFCSERCKLIDLGKWLGEEFRVPGEPVPESSADDEGDDGTP